MGYIYTHIYAHNYNIICFVCLPICACTRVCARTPATKKTGLRRAGSCQCYSGSEPNGSGVHFRQTYIHIRIFFFKPERTKEPCYMRQQRYVGQPPGPLQIYIYIYIYIFFREVSRLTQRIDAQHALARRGRSLNLAETSFYPAARAAAGSVATSAAALRLAEQALPFRDLGQAATGGRRLRLSLRLCSRTLQVSAYVLRLPRRWAFHAAACFLVIRVVARRRALQLQLGCRAFQLVLRRWSRRPTTLQPLLWVGFILATCGRQACLLTISAAPSTGPACLASCADGALRLIASG